MVRHPLDPAASGTCGGQGTELVHDTGADALTAEASLAHQLVYPYRADSESVHSQFDLGLWNRRMIAYGVERQKLFVLGFALSQNATSHQLHLSKAA
ncbi:hypothetical protein ACGFZK_29435 [Streptomyces sp. NPDC048257]|uniref:hypothetical protein n=1 Tax=Streptomyces sp. NPDC048257 TaxID=3365526 RepID=UPI0037166647